MEIKTIFLSSTATDLAPYRNAVYRAIEGLDGYHCVRMEDFGSRHRDASGFCVERVAECDIFVGILGHLYGSCPRGSEQSYTESEYEAAVTADIPCLMFIAPRDFKMSANLREPEDKWRKQSAFRESVKHSQVIDYFTSPEDLARRAVQAVRNLEQAKGTFGSGASETGATTARPLLPEPYANHPYSPRKHFTGRVREREMLTEWLTRDQRTLLTLVGIGGMGKSALAWVWTQSDVMCLPLPGFSYQSPDERDRCQVPQGFQVAGTLWWSFYERESRFSRFLDEALIYFSHGRAKPSAIPSAAGKVRELISLLQQDRFLLVLDAFETELIRRDASRGAGGAGNAKREFRKCRDPIAATFLRDAAASLQSRVLLTSRYYPSELDGRAGCRREDLPRLDPEDGVSFLRAHGIEGTRAELEGLGSAFGYHPLSLELLSGMIVGDPAGQEEAIQVGGHDPVPKLKRRDHHVLEMAYNALDSRTRRLLSRLAAFRSSVDYQAIVTIDPLGDEAQLKRALVELEERNLLQFDARQRQYRMHPVVRRYSYDRLTDKLGVHTQLRDYFASLVTPWTDNTRTREDLSPVIELYHHTVSAEQYVEAIELYRERIHAPLLLRFRDLPTSIELLNLILPDGRECSHVVESASGWRWALGALANVYSLSGVPRRAVSLLESELDDPANWNDREEFTSNLLVLALDQLNLGKLESAEKNLRRLVALQRDMEDVLGESFCRAELGRLLAYEGDSDEASSELDAALRVFDREENKQATCVAWAYQAVRALLSGEAQVALEAAQRASQLAYIFYPGVGQMEFDIIRAEWLLGEARMAVAHPLSSGPNTSCQDRRTSQDLFVLAKDCLDGALARCRRVGAVEFEPDILLAKARWHYMQRNIGQAKERAVEAQAVADDSEYRLKQADAHNLLAKAAIREGDWRTAKIHAAAARERALCDSPSHCYKPALEEAEGVLDRIALVLGSW
jgi:tetratricopeptide (TPR) repeat protein